MRLKPLVQHCVMAGLLALGLLCNLAVRPVKPDLFEEPETALAANAGSAASSKEHAGGLLVPLAWALALVPLGWGVAQTAIKAAQLFR